MADLIPILNQRIRVLQSAAGADLVSSIALNLAMDEIAEMVALDWQANVSSLADPSDGMGIAWFSLDPGDINSGTAEGSRDCLLMVGCMGLHVSATGVKQEDVQKGFYHFPPGLYTAVNPICGVKPHADFAMTMYANLFYRVIRPSANQLAVTIARRR